MKVYELMNELSKVSAGTEVKLDHIISTVDFNRMEQIKEESGNETKHFESDITEVNSRGDIVYLYAEMRC